MKNKRRIIRGFRISYSAYFINSTVLLIKIQIMKHTTPTHLPRVGEVHLVVSDLDRSIEFYQQIDWV